MRKGTIIATWFIESGQAPSMETAERIVRDIFHAEFPNSSFTNWNIEVETSVAEDLIRSARKSKHIDVRLFILDLSEGYFG